MAKLSVVLATRNEEQNIARCLESVRGIADEIIVMDEGSDDRTSEIAKNFGAKVFEVPHEPIFHKTKQKALAKASGDWILQLDADEVVTPALAKEIEKVVSGRWKASGGRKSKLFKRHQEAIEMRDGKIGKETGEIVGFFVPRVNFFLRKPLIHAGVYPDGVIRLVKKGKARFPAKSVHEQIALEGEAAWLMGDLEHHDTPTLKRYFARMNRYTDLHARELSARKAPRNIFYMVYYSFLLPVFIFLKLYIRHKGFMDGVRGFMWSAFSSWHYPLAYFKYWVNRSL